MALSGKLLEWYRSSAIREAVLSWYPFDPSACCLDLSAGMLHGLLSQRLAEVHTAPLPGIRYDYLVVLDPPDLSNEVLAHLHAAASDRGKLLVAYENPFALRYWAGHTAPGTGRPYDTLFGRGESPLPGKAELAARLARAGFAAAKWYYPLADHWLTTEVYSDTFLPNEFYNQRLVPYLDDDEGRCFDERGLYREIVRGGAFEFMCGAYLVEARVCADDAPCAVEYAAVTAYREPRKRFATTLCDDGTAVKAPLHPDGVATIGRIAKNHDELRSLGLQVVEGEVVNGTLVMPRVGLPTLYDYWAMRLAVGRLSATEVTVAFDRIRDDIYRAAQNGTCYWELVPANCFYDADKDALIYFDQEYCTKGISPDLALARAVSGLRYSPAFAEVPWAQGLYESLVERYGLQDGRDMIRELAELDTYSEVFGDEHRLMQDLTRKHAARIGQRREAAV